MKKFWAFDDGLALVQATLPVELNSQQGAYPLEVARDLIEASHARRCGSDGIEVLFDAGLPALLGLFRAATGECKEDLVASRETDAVELLESASLEHLFERV